MREQCPAKGVKELRDTRGIIGEMGMSSLLLRCLRREPSAGEIVPQIRSEAKLQCRGLCLRNRSNTNRGQSSCLEHSQEDILVKGTKKEKETYP